MCLIIVQLGYTCTDPVLCQGGGSKPDDQKTALTTLVFCLFLVQLVLLFTEGVQCFKEKYTFPRIQGGGGGGGGGGGEGCPNEYFYRNP